MYEISIDNGGTTQLIHETDSHSLRRLAAGKLAEEVSGIPSFSFTVPASNPCFASGLIDRKTILTMTNIRTNEVEFEGTLLNSTTSMSTSGVLSKKAVAEGFLAYLCDSVQPYHHYEGKTVTEFLTALLDWHNSITPAEKHITLGSCDFSGDNTNSKTTAYRSTLEEIKINLIERIGGEIRVRRVNGSLVLDFLHQYGTTSSTKIELAKNMKSLAVSSDSTHIVSRLIPLGAQLDPGNSAERLDITSVNSGCMYIDDAAAIAAYGVIVGTVTFDDITVASNLLSAGQAYLANNNRIKKSYAGQVLDLSILDSSQQSIRAGNTYTFVNSFMGLNEPLRVMKRTVDIYKPWSPQIEIGDKSERMTDIAVRTNQLIEYELPQRENSILSSARDIATALINAGINGYVVVNGNEILIMDTPDKETATKVWRWNSGGFGYSSNGYEGPYSTAITMNGAIVADFITAGVLRGIEINNGSGTFHVDSSGNVVASSMTINGGVINNGNGTFSVDANGNVSASAITINNGSGTFYVDSSGNVTASAISITGGTINITTQDNTRSIIKLNGNNVHNWQLPGGWQLISDTNDTEVTADGFAIRLYKNASTSSPTTTLTINALAGQIDADGQINAGGNISSDSDVIAHDTGGAAISMRNLASRVAALENQ